MFLFRHILKKDFGDHKDTPRAKKSSYIPVVLTRKEVDAVISRLASPYDLVVKLLYGCGLRLFLYIFLGHLPHFLFRRGRKEAFQFFVPADPLCKIAGF